MVYNPKNDVIVTWFVDAFRRMEHNELYEPRFVAIMHLIEEEMRKW